jgi:DUF1680 family protein
VGPVSPRSTDSLAVFPLGLDQVGLVGGFFGDWQEANRGVSTPHALAWLERDGSVDNLRKVGGGGGPHQGMWFSDSDVHKVIEALAWDLGRAPSADLAAVVSALAAELARAQLPDGYLNSYVQRGFGVRWESLVVSHELYCLGHLIQAGVAHQRATGGDEVMAIALRAADCVVRDFGGNRRKDTDGHPVIESALVELYRQTGVVSYLDLAQQFLDVRGFGVLPTEGHFDSAYYQDATPVRQQTTVVGHAVRAMYLLAGVVDVYLETGERALLDAALRQWDSLVETKLYLTGAVGSRFEGESFGDEYELPPDLVYGETCATIGAFMAAWRLLLATGDSRFADAMERGLFNLVAASTSVGRDAFFYNNPAQRRTAHPAADPDVRQSRADAPGTRPAWFKCSCCPPNIMRTVAALAGHVATHTPTGVQIHQFLAARITTPLAGLTQHTAYPSDGVVEIVVDEVAGPEWTLGLRVPGWCRGQSVSVNGVPMSAAPDEHGYLAIAREWHVGDVVRYDMPMPARLTVAHPAVDAVHGMAAVERGPLVYCFESPDQPENVDLNRVELLTAEPLVCEPGQNLPGSSTIVVRVAAMVRDDTPWQRVGWATLDEAPERVGRRVELVAVPYHLWANRGPSVMRIYTPIWPG